MIIKTDTSLFVTNADNQLGQSIPGWVQADENVFRLTSRARQHKLPPDNGRVGWTKSTRNTGRVK